MRRFNALCLSLALSTGFVRAAAADDLQTAERAYREVDFELARESAERALARGGHALRETARLQLLLGVASAALGKDAEAQAAFVRLLAIDANQSLDRDLSPRMRAPYLEARGFWSSTAERLSATLQLESGRFVVRVVDPANMVHSVRLGTRPSPHGVFHEARYPSARVLSVDAEMPGDPQVIEVTVALLDQHDNVIHELGTHSQPVSLRMPRAASIKDLNTTLSSQRPPNYLLSGVLSALGAGAVGAGVFFHVEREREAGSWNGEGCERPGATRREQCKSVKGRLERDQWLAVGLYSTGGALLSAGVITLLSGKARESATATAAGFSCGSDASGPWTLACSGRF